MKQTMTQNQDLPNIINYPIVETFHSIQGEGAFAGVNAFFIRLGWCDVHCPWCDQKETWTPKGHPQKNVLELALEAQQVKPEIVIITGGEPLLHDLNPLTQALHDYDLKVHLETSGAHPFSGEFDWVTFSPKTFKEPHESIYAQVHELKVVIATQKDLLWAEAQGEKIPPHALKYLQPEWDSPESQNLIFDYVLHHPQWRVSLQTHKFLGIR
jgi:7-carboxy-7-deazaguanine synthase